MKFRHLRQTALMTTAMLGAPLPALAGDFAGFEEPVLYPVDFLPWSIRAGDLDGDGDIDLITANIGVPSSNLSLLFNHGDGTFAEVVNIPIANATTDVAITDLDGDGIVDLAATFGGNSPLGGGPVGGLALLKGLGGGEFAEPTFFNAGVQPFSIDAGDFNDDGAPDLILVNQLSNNVSVFINNGDGNFAPQTFYPVGIRPQRVAVADMDADGNLDAVVVHIFSDDLYVLLNNGAGEFESLPPVDTPFGGNSGLPIADLDGDSLPDVIVSTGSLGIVSVHYNIGDGILAAPLILEFPKPVGVTISHGVDLDNDSNVDIASGVRKEAPDPIANPAQEAIFRGDGFDEFVLLQPYFDWGINGHPPSAQCVADLDNDGDTDIAAAFGNEVSVLLNKTNIPNAVDLTGDGFVNTPDLLILLNAWGRSGMADFDKSGAVDGRDLAHLLSNWSAPAHRAPVSHPPPQRGSQ